MRYGAALRRLCLALSVIAVGCSHSDAPKDSSGIGQLKAKSRNSLQSKLAAMDPAQRQEYVQTHPQEMMGAFGTGLPKAPGPSTTP